MNKNKLKEFLTYGAIIVVFVFSLSFYKPASSDVSGSLSGYAWNSYKVNTGDTDNKWLGMAWLGFNVSSGAVSVDNTTGDLSGYAWSPYYGWLKFGGFSGFPSGSGTVSSNAKFNFSNNTLTGWARFCGVFASGCSGSLFPDSNNGGWDGWVSLSGTGYGAVLNPSDLMLLEL